MNSGDQNRRCFNCGINIDVADKYCHNCGQKNSDGKVKMSELLREFFSDQLSLDSKLFKTLVALVIPGRLTKEYFRGRHKSYINPLRIFFFLAIIAIGLVIAYTPEDSAFKTSDFNSLDKNFFDKREMIFGILDSIDLLRKQYPVDSMQQSILDSLESMYTSGNQAFLIDSFPINFYSMNLTDEEGSVLSSKSADIKIAVDDLLNMPSKELFTQYGIDGFYKRIAFNQLRKTILDGSSFNTYLFGNLPWILLFMMPVLAFVLKLMYIRRDFYYVEHLIFSFHIHSFLFILAIVALLLFKWVNFVVPTGPSMIIICSYILIAIKKYYNQSYLKSILKLFIVTLAYLILTALFLIFGAAISILLF